MKFNKDLSSFFSIEKLERFKYYLKNNFGLRESYLEDWTQDKNFFGYQFFILCYEISQGKVIKINDEKIYFPSESKIDLEFLFQVVDKESIVFFVETFLIDLANHIFCENKFQGIHKSWLVNNYQDVYINDKAVFLKPIDPFLKYYCIYCYSKESYDELIISSRKNSCSIIDLDNLKLFYKPRSYDIENLRLDFFGIHKIYSILIDFNKFNTHFMKFFKLDNEKFRLN